MTLAGAIILWAAIGVEFGRRAVVLPSTVQLAAADGMHTATLWMEDACDRVSNGSPEWRWMWGCINFTRTLAAELRDIRFRVP